MLRVEIFFFFVTRMKGELFQPLFPAPWKWGKLVRDWGKTVWEIAYFATFRGYMRLSLGRISTFGHFGSIGIPILLPSPSSTQDTDRNFTEYQYKRSEEQEEEEKSPPL